MHGCTRRHGDDLCGESNCLKTADVAGWCWQSISQSTSHSTAVKSEKGASHCPFLLLAGSRPRKHAETRVKIDTRIRGLRHKRKRARSARCSPRQSKARRPGFSSCMPPRGEPTARPIAVSCAVQRTGQTATGTVPLKWLGCSSEEKSSRGGNKDTLPQRFQNPCLWRGFLFDRSSRPWHVNRTVAALSFERRMLGS